MDCGCLGGEYGQSDPIRRLWDWEVPHGKAGTQEIRRFLAATRWACCCAADLPVRWRTRTCLSTLASVPDPLDVQRQAHQIPLAVAPIAKPYAGCIGRNPSTSLIHPFGAVREPLALQAYRAYAYVTARTASHSHAVAWQLEPDAGVSDRSRRATCPQRPSATCAFRCRRFWGSSSRSVCCRWCG